MTHSDPTRMLLIDTSSATRSEDVITALVRGLDGFAVNLLQTKDAATTAMTSWLQTGELSKLIPDLIDALGRLLVLEQAA